MKPAKKQSNLKIVPASTDPAVKADTTLSAEERREKRSQVNQQWEEMENKWRITCEEVHRRVFLLRRELEQYQYALEGMPFDLPADDMPCCMYAAPKKYLFQLVEELNPLVEKYFQKIDEFAEEHGTHEFLDFNSKLSCLRAEAAHAGFQIGVLFGVIAAGCSDKTIDRFERGLITALQSNPSIIK